MENLISEQFRKYLVGFILNNEKYYTVCGVDLQDEEKDKVLTDKDNRILVFRDVAKLIDFIKRQNDLFDVSNVKEWANRISIDVETYSDLRIDSLKSIDETLINASLHKEIVMVLYFIQDYSIQVDHLEMNELIQSTDITKFKNDYVEQMVFIPSASPPLKNEPVALSSKLQKSLNTLYTMIINCIVIK